MQNTTLDKRRDLRLSSTSIYEIKNYSEKLKLVDNLKLPHVQESTVKFNKDQVVSIEEDNQLTPVQKELESGTLTQQNKLDFIYNTLNLVEHFYLLGLINGNLRLSNILIDKDGKLCINDCLLDELLCTYDKFIHFNFVEAIIIIIYQILEGCNLFANKSLYEIAKMKIQSLKPSINNYDLESLILSNCNNKLFEELQLELSTIITTGTTATSYDDWKNNRPTNTTMISLFKDNDFYYKFYHIVDPYTSIYYYLLFIHSFIMI